MPADAAPTTWTVQQLLAWTTKHFAGKNIDQPSVEARTLLAGWLRHARTCYAKLCVLTDQIHAIEVPEPIGGVEVITEFDRRRGIKAQLLDATVQTAVEMAAAARLLAALLPKPQELPGGEGSLGPTARLNAWEAAAMQLERAPKKLGSWFIGETKPSTATCTAHVFKMHGDQGLFTIAWYDQGVRVVDVAGLADLATSPVPFTTFGDGNGIKEIGSYVFEDSNTWAFKTGAIAKDGSFFGFGNDLGRGLDVYRFAGLDRRVPALVPTDLAPVAGARGELLPFLPAGVPSGPALLGLAGLLVLGATTSLVRRTARGRAPVGAATA